MLLSFHINVIIGWTGVCDLAGHQCIIDVWVQISEIDLVYSSLYGFLPKMCLTLTGNESVILLFGY